MSRPTGVDLLLDQERVRRAAIFLEQFSRLEVSTRNGVVMLKQSPGSRNVALDLRGLTASGGSAAQSLFQPPGPNGYVAFSDSSAPNGVTWVDLGVEYLNWIADVEAAGGTFTTYSKAVAARLLRGLQAASYGSKIVYFLPLLGGNLNAALIPLRDLLGLGAMTNVNFVNADFDETVGLQGNGSNKCLVAPFRPSQIGSGNNGGVGWIQRNVSVASGTQYTAGMVYNQTAPTNTFGIRFGNSPGDVNCQFYWGENGTEASISELRSDSHYYGQRSSATDRRLFKNGVKVAQNTTNDAAVRSAVNEFNIFAVNFDGTPLAFNAGACACSYFTDGTLSDAEAEDFNTLLSEALITPLGR